MEKPGILCIHGVYTRPLTQEHDWQTANRQRTDRVSLSCCRHSKQSGVHKGASFSPWSNYVARPLISEDANAVEPGTSHASRCFLTCRAQGQVTGWHIPPVAATTPGRERGVRAASTKPAGRPHLSTCVTVVVYTYIARLTPPRPEHGYSQPRKQPQETLCKEMSPNTACLWPELVSA